jgi:hypothetical protein
MRTLIIIVIGLGFWAGCIAITRLAGKFSPAAMTAATWTFVAIWFVAAATNMWVGVSRAGYSFQDELPIFLLIFLLPTAVALFAKWKFL